jgi:hypothetical protein
MRRPRQPDRAYSGARTGAVTLRSAPSRQSTAERTLRR